MTFSLVLLILEVILKVPDIVADIKALIAKIRGLEKGRRLSGLAQLSVLLKNHAGNSTLKGTDLSHDLALLHESLDP